MMHRSPGDWQRRCTRDYHLHQYLLNNRRSILKRLAWTEQEPKTLYDCQPAARYSMLTSNWVKVFTISYKCTICRRKGNISMSNDRAIASIVTPDKELWK